MSTERASRERIAEQIERVKTRIWVQKQVIRGDLASLRVSRKELALYQAELARLQEAQP